MLNLLCGQFVPGSEVRPALALYSPTQRARPLFHGDQQGRNADSLRPDDAVARIRLSFTLPLTCDRRSVRIGILRQSAIPDWSETKVPASSIGGWIIVIAAGSLTVWTGQVTAADTDSDRKAVEAVCGRCHTTELFLKQRRSWARWNEVFADMVERGADGTDDQLDGVSRYFLENLTLVNVNHAPAEELRGVLGISGDVAEAIIARREHQPFADLAQLREIKGIDPDILEQRKSRILF